MSRNKRKEEEMKVEELIYNLGKMDPDPEVTVLVAQDRKLTVYGTDVADVVVTRKIEDEKGEKNICTSDVHTYE